MKQSKFTDSHISGIDQSRWLMLSESFDECFSRFAGSERSLRTAREKLKYQRTSGLSRCRKMIGQAQISTP